MSKAECEYLQNLTDQHEATVLSFKKPRLLRIPIHPSSISVNSILPGNINTTKYDLSIYIKSNILRFCTVSPTIIKGSVTAVQDINGFNIYNTFKPPNVK